MKIIIRIAAGMISAVFALLLLACGVFGIKGYDMYRKAVKETPVDGLYEKISESSGFTSYDELPETYIDAVISAEDKRFESHCGIDVLAIARAVWTDIKTVSFAEGGSTITQQLAKNEFFTQGKTLTRKFAEVFAAFSIERTYSKEQIFEMYVNTINFGSGYYGINSAAEGYFGKEPCELDDSEAVVLAGIPNAPSVYSPDSSVVLAEKRAGAVLNRMIHCGKISSGRAGVISADISLMLRYHVLRPAA